MANNNFYNRDPFGNMDDIFNSLMGNMGAIIVRINDT